MNFSKKLCLFAALINKVHCLKTASRYIATQVYSLINKFIFVPKFLKLTAAKANLNPILLSQDPKHNFGAGNKYNLADIKTFLTYVACVKVNYLSD
ncbi:hypothetical protein BpHYR1_043688 [Brachionus plicatilis]|uniref:Uncharacterized protein n=1 Tax=Brachionus plicatilis TaxID=10195 RepID=A0A3M7RQP7_BRAPC|nr:hypothetical protein BpHYR1_043688 [Brachionus plicatilis]